MTITDHTAIADALAVVRNDPKAEVPDVLVREAGLNMPEGYESWTAEIVFKDDKRFRGNTIIEEMDLAVHRTASDEGLVLRKVEAILSRDYMPGWTSIHLSRGF